MFSFLLVNIHAYNWNIAGKLDKNREEVLVVHKMFSMARINPIDTCDFYMRTLANSEDPDEMPHHAAFHLGLHYLLRQKRSSEK